MTGDKTKKIEFGGRDTRTRKEREEAAQDAARRRRARRDGVTRLLKSQAFRDWFYGVVEEMCGFDFGLDMQDEFVMGKRASASLLKQSILIGDGSAEFLGELTTRHFNAVREAARRTTNHRN